MPTYDASLVDDTQLAHKKAFTVEKARGLRDNPQAVWEGATGAPKVQGHALGNTFLGYFSGTALTSGIDFDTQAKTLIIHAEVPNSSAFQIGFSDDGGSTFGSTQTVDSGSGTRSVYAVIDLETGARSAIHREYATNTVSETTSSLTVPTDCNSIRIGAASSQFYAFVYILGGKA